jgi:hypothetical protein
MSNENQMIKRNTLVIFSILLMTVYFSLAAANAAEACCEIVPAGAKYGWE